jgi:hypothetical protein
MKTGIFQHDDSTGVLAFDKGFFSVAAVFARENNGFTKLGLKIRGDRSHTMFAFDVYFFVKSFSIFFGFFFRFFHVFGRIAKV